MISNNTLKNGFISFGQTGVTVIRDSIKDTWGMTGIDSDLTVMGTNTWLKISPRPDNPFYVENNEDITTPESLMDKANFLTTDGKTRHVKEYFQTLDSIVNTMLAASGKKRVVILTPTIFHAGRGFVHNTSDLYLDEEDFYNRIYTSLKQEIKNHIPAKTFINWFMDKDTLVLIPTDENHHDEKDIFNIVRLSDIIPMNDELKEMFDKTVGNGYGPMLKADMTFECKNEDKETDAMDGTLLFGENANGNIFSIMPPYENSFSFITTGQTLTGKAVDIDSLTDKVSNVEKVLNVIYQNTLCYTAKKDFPNKQYVKHANALITSLFKNITNDGTLKDAIEQTRKDKEYAYVNEIGNFVKKTNEKALSAKRNAIKDVSNVYQTTLRQLLDHSNKVQELQKEINFLEKIFTENVEEVTKELTTIKNHVLSDLVYVTEKTLHIITNPLYIKSPLTGSIYYLGRVRIEISNNILAGGNIDTIPIQIKHHSHIAEWPHPHVRDSSYPCWGNGTEMLIDAIQKRDWGMLMDIIAMFLQTVNIDDDWGKIIKEYPCVTSEEMLAEAKELWNLSPGPDVTWIETHGTAEQKAALREELEAQQERESEEE